MATYKDKNKLIDESKDVYISDYDKTLDYSYLSDIIDQKRAYKTAEDAGDTAGMKKANDRANSIRTQAASYTAGEDGSKYQRVKRPYEASTPQKARSAYDGEKDRVYGLISSYGDFNYDVYSDPLYKTYKDIYLLLGDEAYERALSQNAMRTGGVTSTSAISAATAAKNRYNKMLADKVPELYDRAYSKYRDGLDDLYDMLSKADDFEERDYLRYRDEVDDYKADRDYYYEKDKEIADNLYGIYRDETDYEYDAYRDFVEDSRKDDELELDKEKSQNDKMTIAVNLAKALYGKTPISSSVINSIMSMLK